MFLRKSPILYVCLLFLLLGVAGCGGQSKTPAKRNPEAKQKVLSRPATPQNLEVTSFYELRNNEDMLVGMLFHLAWLPGDQTTTTYKVYGSFKYPDKTEWDKPRLISTVEIEEDKVKAGLKGRYSIEVPVDTEVKLYVVGTNNAGESDISNIVEIDRKFWQQFKNFSNVKTSVEIKPMRRYDSPELPAEIVRHPIFRNWITSKIQLPGFGSVPPEQVYNPFSAKDFRLYHTAKLTSCSCIERLHDRPGILSSPTEDYPVGARKKVWSPGGECCLIIYDDPPDTGVFLYGRKGKDRIEYLSWVGPGNDWEEAFWLDDDVVVILGYGQNEELGQYLSSLKFSSEADEAPDLLRWFADRFVEIVDLSQNKRVMYRADGYQKYRESRESG